MKETTHDHLERKSLRILGRNKDKSKTTVMKTVHTVTEQMKGSVFVAKKFQPSWSGILVVDGKGIKVFDQRAKSMNLSVLTSRQIKRLHRKVWLSGIDYLTGDLPHYALADEETKIDLVMFFQVLKNEMHYELRVLVCDGNDDIISAALKVYGPTFLIQRCTRHYLETLQIRAGRLSVIEHPRTQELVSNIKSIIQVKDLQTTNQRLTSFKRKRFSHPAHQELIKDFLEDVDTLTTYLQYPNIPIPHTNNDIENLFRQLNQRTRGISRFGHWNYAAHYLKAWSLMRRFTQFTDCKGRRKIRNGKAPLTLAGCDIDGIDYFDL